MDCMNSWRHENWELSRCGPTVLKGCTSAAKLKLKQVAADLGSHASEKQLPDWNPVHQKKQKSEEKEPEEKLLYFTAGKQITLACV